MSLFSIGRMKSAAMTTLSGSALPIAIDFGSSSLKLLQLAAGEPPTLIAAAAVDTPDALLGDPGKRLQFQCQALPRLIKAAGFKGRRAMFAIPAAAMVCKHMQFPKSDSAPLEDMVQAAVPAALGIAADQVILRHFAVDGARAPGSASAGGGAPGSAGAGAGAVGIKQEVICLAASRDIVNRIIGAIGEAKLEVVGVHPECIASVRAFDQITRRVADDHLATLYLDLASTSTKVWMAHGKRLVFAKVIQMGGYDLDMVVARALDVKLAQARARRVAATVLVAPAALPAGAVGAGAAGSAPARGGDAALGEHRFLETLAAAVTTSAVVTEDRRVGGTPVGLTPSLSVQAPADLSPPEFDLHVPLETMTDEIAMCVRYYESMFPGRKLDRAIFFGGESRHRGFSQAIARRLRTPAHVADPVARIGRSGSEPCLGVSFAGPQPGWTVALGLSLCPADM
jgi:Tfp pilus assembly PilM family ATPase